VNLCPPLSFVADRVTKEGRVTINELPLSCPHCGQTTVKPVAWLQQNTFFTCQSCGTAVLIDKDVAAQRLAELELRQRQ
jgi:predicted RNA-binding Zn-ribbon protein involved in translation (DUF1610 family)